MVTFEYILKFNGINRSFADIVGYIERDGSCDTTYIFNTGELLELDYEGFDKIKIINSNIKNGDFDHLDFGDFSFYLHKYKTTSSTINIIMDKLNSEIETCLNMLDFFTVKQLTPYKAEIKPLN